jgi:hypothetical protein
VNHEISPAPIMQVVEKGKRTKEKAPKLSQIRAAPLGERDKGRYQAQADLRQGGDRGTPRPYLLILATQDEIMKAKEREFKSRCASTGPNHSYAELSCVHDFEESGRAKKGRIRAMAASSSTKPSLEERLKAMDSTLENLKQMLQFQLDFLENLDSEAGRRMEKLEQDITTTKFGFTEELSKLHQELKNPKKEFEERIGQLEEKMSQLNNEWRQDPKN